MTYAVTGASGHLGRRAAQTLLERIEPAELVLLTRTPETLAEFADRGVDVRPADFAHPETLVDAFAGVQRVLLVSVHATPARVDSQRAAIDAARAAGVERIAYTSFPRPVPENPTGVVPDHAATEQYLKDSGLRWVMLRNNQYSDLQLDVLRRAASSGRFVTNVGDGRVAFVTRDDCADAAAGALLAEDDANRADDITGPEALGAADLAHLASRIGGRRVDVVDLDDAAFTAGSIAAGVPEQVAGLITSFGAATRGGWLAEVTGAVQELAGRAPTRLSDLVRAA